jgi:hypothetical protein
VLIGATHGRSLEAKGRRLSRPFCLQRSLFIAHSEKTNSAEPQDRGEHLTSRFVVGAGNANT